jgi:hypothetical protein
MIKNLEGNYETFLSASLIGTQILLCLELSLKPIYPMLPTIPPVSIIDIDMMRQTECLFDPSLDKNTEDFMLLAMNILKKDISQKTQSIEFYKSIVVWGN